MDKNEQLHNEIASIKERIKQLEEFLHDNVMTVDKTSEDVSQES